MMPIDSWPTIQNLLWDVPPIPCWMHLVSTVRSMLHMLGRGIKEVNVSIQYLPSGMNSKLKWQAIIILNKPKEKNMFCKECILSVAIKQAIGISCPSPDMGQKILLIWFTYVLKLLISCLCLYHYDIFEALRPKDSRHQNLRNPCSDIVIHIWSEIFNVIIMSHHIMQGNYDK